MRIRDEVLQGFALAATAAGDRGASRALAGLSDELQGIARAAQQGMALSKDERERRIAAWARAAAGRFDTPPGGENPRALALLAGHAPPTLGKSLLASAPAPRPGYAADAELLQVLLGTWRALSR